MDKTTTPEYKALQLQLKIAIKAGTETEILAVRQRISAYLRTPATDCPVGLGLTGLGDLARRY